MPRRHLISERFPAWSLLRRRRWFKTRRRKQTPTTIWRNRTPIGGHMAYESGAPTRRDQQHYKLGNSLK